MKTENILLWGLGAFVAYKVLFQPKASPIPTQSLPVYTPSGTNINTTSSGSNTGSLLALGAGLVTSIIKAINPGNQTTTSSGGQTNATVDQTQQAATNDFINSQVSDIFGSSAPTLQQTSLISGIEPANYFNNVNEDDLD